MPSCAASTPVRGPDEAAPRRSRPRWPRWAARPGLLLARRLRRGHRRPGAAARVGTVVEVCFEADDPELLGLPFEALRLPDDRLLATMPSVVTLRRPAGIAVKRSRRWRDRSRSSSRLRPPTRGTPAPPCSTTSGSFRTSSTRWRWRSAKNVEVRILEVGHPGDRGGDRAGRLPRAPPVVPRRPGAARARGRRRQGRAHHRRGPHRADPRLGRPLPLVFLNACHGGVQEEQTASLAESLLRAGVPGVVAMQTSVSDHYATQLARAFYEHLARREPPMASLAGRARKEVEQRGSRPSSGWHPPPRHSRSTPPPRCTSRATRRPSPTSP